MRNKQKTSKQNQTKESKAGENKGKEKTEDWHLVPLRVLQTVRRRRQARKHDTNTYLHKPTHAKTQARTQAPTHLSPTRPTGTPSCTPIHPPTAHTPTRLENVTCQRMHARTHASKHTHKCRGGSRIAGWTQRKVFRNQ